MQGISRRTVLRIGLSCAAPAVLRGRFQLFAQSKPEYAARAIQLLAETTIVDLLNQFRFADYSENPPKSELWLNQPWSFTADDAAIITLWGSDNAGRARCSGEAGAVRPRYLSRPDPGTHAREKR